MCTFIQVCVCWLTPSIPSDMWLPHLNLQQMDSMICRDLGSCWPETHWQFCAPTYTIFCAPSFNDLKINVQVLIFGVLEVPILFYIPPYVSVPRYIIFGKCQASRLPDKNNFIMPLFIYICISSWNNPLAVSLMCMCSTWAIVLSFIPKVWFLFTLILGLQAISLCMECHFSNMSHAFVFW